MPISQGRLGRVSIGGTLYPVYDWQISAPRNLQQGQPVGNTWATTKGEGLQSSRFTARIMCREAAAEILNTAFWNMFLTRSWGLGFDDTAPQTIIAASGLNNYTLSNAKAESFQLVVQKGAVVGLSVAFLAPGLPTKAGTTSATSYLNTIDNSPLLMFDKATFGGFSGSVYSATINYSNNHLPNAPLDGTKTVSAWEAGPITVSASFTVQEWLAAATPIPDDSTLTVALNAVRTLSLTRVTPENPRDVGVNPGQVFQSLACIVQGTNAVAPLVVS